MASGEDLAFSPSTRMVRKLTAILIADVKGYSRLMGEDEAATIQTLAVHKALIETCV
jgi:class 3 adenylate cyclase